MKKRKEKEKRTKAFFSNLNFNGVSFQNIVFRHIYFLFARACFNRIVSNRLDGEVRFSRFRAGGRIRNRKGVASVCVRFYLLVVIKDTALIGLNRQR